MDQNQQLHDQLAQLKIQVKQKGGAGSSDANSTQIAEQLEKKNEIVKHAYGFDRFDVALDSQVTSTFFDMLKMQSATSAPKAGAVKGKK